MPSLQAFLPLFQLGRHMFLRLTLSTSPCLLPHFMSLMTHGLLKILSLRLLLKTLFIKTIPSWLAPRQHGS